jgi:hypothetical protein
VRVDIGHHHHHQQQQQFTLPMIVHGALYVTNGELKAIALSK